MTTKVPAERGVETDTCGATRWLLGDWTLELLSRARVAVAHRRPVVVDWPAAFPDAGARGALAA
eukprot:gene50859-36080_t